MEVPHGSTSIPYVEMTNALALAYALATYAIHIMYILHIILYIIIYYKLYYVL